MNSLKRHEGWLLIDHSASPGIPADIARRIGYAPEDVAEGAVFETATLTCKHCKTSYIKNRFRIRPREYCRKCDHYICDGCAQQAAQPDYVHRCGEEILDATLTAAQTGQVFDLSTPKNPSIIIP